VNTLINKKIEVIDLGLSEYQEAWDFQTTKFDATVSKKIQIRAGESGITENFLIFCEHPHVFTLGKSGKESNLIIPKSDLSKINATYHHINRGGDITYHGPGQLVVYPVLDLENFFTDIHQYMRLLEEVVIRTVAEYGITASRLPGMTGVWLDPEVPGRSRKICAMGVRTSRWVTLHGLALNVNTDLNYFGYIVPCGISDKAVTSVQQETGKPVDINEVKIILLKHFLEIFGATEKVHD
jgi:lipoyl(octanoyl) transferase